MLDNRKRFTRRLEGARGAVLSSIEIYITVNCNVVPVPGMEVKKKFSKFLLAAVSVVVAGLLLVLFLLSNQS